MGEGRPGKRKRVAVQALAAPGAPEAPGPPQGPGSASKGNEGAAWHGGVKPSCLAAAVEATRVHLGKKSGSDSASESWISEEEFEASLPHIPRVGASQLHTKTITMASIRVGVEAPLSRAQDAAMSLRRRLLGIIPFQGAPRQSTLSVALPASIVANAQSLEMKAALVGQVARTLTIMGVDEVVIYEDEASAVDPSTRVSPSLSFFVRNLQYLETPQFLRKRLFKLHPGKDLQEKLGFVSSSSDLKFAGLQNPLDAPHHLRRSEWLPYREGVVIDGTPSEGGGCLVDCGLAHPVECLQQVRQGTRVTLRLHPGMRGAGDGSRLSARQRRTVFRGEAVSAQEPPTRAGLYWGYQVRAASSLRGVFYGHSLGGEARGLYDCLLGTSERGLPLADVAQSLQAGSYRHLLVVFGGLQGLEAVVGNRQAGLCPSTARQATRLCLEGDRGDASAAEVRRAWRRLARQGGPGGPLEAFAKGDTQAIPPSTLFDFFVNTCPLQASRTIRAEEALLVTLAALRQAGIHSRGPPPQQEEVRTVDCRKEKKRKLHMPPLIRVMMELEAQSQQQ
ncbi:hypothetical protein Esti_006004 [Eimeria stiedai]